MGSTEFQPITSEEGFRELVALLDSSFPVPIGGSFLDDFPVWGMKRRGEVLHLGGYRGGMLVSCAAARVAMYKAPAGDLPIGLIGAVATHASCRGQGLASHTVAKAVDWLRGKGVALAMLWGSEHELYRKLGFELCGNQLTLPLSRLGLPASSRSGALRKGWVSGLFESLAARPWGLRLGPEDRAWVQAHKNVQWYWLGDPARPAAYAALGRGIDLGDLVHEWGGEPEALRELLALIRKAHPESSLLASPALLREQGLAEALGSPGTATEFLCMARFMDLARDPGRVFEAFSKDTEMGGSLPELQAVDGRDLIQVFFGGPGIPTPPAAAHLLPFPLWLWGLDGA